MKCDGSVIFFLPCFFIHSISFLFFLPLRGIYSIFVGKCVDCYNTIIGNT